ncbi:MAG: aromatic amino acid lyase, partial [Clostridia bacterium]|nr:aromatic amino acid lyase [Clostridia bacterium]
SHIILVMLGEGEAEYEGVRMSGQEAMDKAGIPTIELSAKEGLALINGTQIMTSMAALLCYDARNLAKTADIAVCMTGEALNAITKAYDPKVHEVRGHQGQMDAAANMLKILSDSQNAGKIQPGKVQDAYSLRCAPQVHGASRDAIEYVYAAVTREINAVTDNPLVFSDHDDVISAGNFHGQPMALAMDFLAIAMAEYANISERRTERLVNPQLSAGLPAFLTADGGLNSGFMIVQYSAASMVSESKVYCHPASVDSIPSSANQEDHVSMGTTAARKARMVLDNSQKVLAIELFCATQGIYFRGEDKLGTAGKAVYEHVRKSVQPVKEDRVMYTEMAKFDAMVKNNEIVDVVEKAIGTLR